MVEIQNLGLKNIVMNICHLVLVENNFLFNFHKQCEKKGSLLCYSGVMTIYPMPIHPMPLHPMLPYAIIHNAIIPNAIIPNAIIPNAIIPNVF